MLFRSYFHYKVYDCDGAFGQCTNFLNLYTCYELFHVKKDEFKHHKEYRVWEKAPLNTNFIHDAEIYHGRSKFYGGR